jgi:alpha-L-fucosidase 2
LALTEANACVTAGYHVIKQDQAAYYRKHYGAVKMKIENTLSLVDTESRLLAKNRDLGLVELLFNFGRYLTVASSAKGSQATNLQGIWNEALCAIWKSNYTVNINTEMNYWQTLMCGLSEFHLPVVELVKKIADTGSVTAKEFYHANGFVCHHNIDLWGNTVAVGGAGEEFIPGNSNFSFWCGASGWLCRNVFEYYEYTLDQDFLREVAYPLLKAAAEFYLDILHPVGDRLAISPTTSPENQYYLNGEIHAMSTWTAMMQSIVEDLFRNCVTCCDILKVDADWKADLERIIPKLMPFDIDSEGRLLEWDEEKEERDREHRHVSHLYGLYPADLITTESTPRLAQACKRVLETRGDEGTGWSLAWKACLWAKLKDGEHALKLIMRQLDVIDSEHTSCELWGGVTYPNLFCAHPPFQIDGNFGITAAIAMLFLQCEDAKIKILPALPKAFPNGYVNGLVAKGDIKVDIAWQNGIATEVCLQSPTSQTVSLLVNGTLQKIRLESNQPYQYLY